MVMHEKALNYKQLRNELSRKTMVRVFTRGYGGPLTFLWAAGLGVLTLVFQWPLGSWLWSLGCASLAGLMTRSTLRNYEV
ncbi:hypothetical protein, partial [Oceanicoccus sp.]|uniref:hypothetical protein n=1 Tax=Oceanicoccus sp. TaxID=2691044 RepID=UPI00260FE1E5